MDRMRLGHASALALMSWYLMMPPWHPALDVSAPLGRWTPFKEGFKGACISSSRCPPFSSDPLGPESAGFKDLHDCEASQLELKNAVKHRPENKWIGFEHRAENWRTFLPSDKDFAVMASHSLCVADDDPRFKGNIRYKGN
jgi:hypothetical protein